MGGEGCGYDTPMRRMSGMVALAKMVAMLELLFSFLLLLVGVLGGEGNAVVVHSGAVLFPPRLVFIIIER